MQPMTSADPGTCITYVVEEVSPPFHGDALENRQHCKQDVVELSDPIVGPFPVGLTFGPIGAGAGGFLCPTWSRRLTLNVIYEREGEKSQGKGLGKPTLRNRGCKDSIMLGKNDYWNEFISLFFFKFGFIDLFTVSFYYFLLQALLLFLCISSTFEMDSRSFRAINCPLCAALAASHNICHALLSLLLKQNIWQFPLFLL